MCYSLFLLFLDWGKRSEDTACIDRSVGGTVVGGRGKGVSREEWVSDANLEGKRSR